MLNDAQWFEPGLRVVACRRKAETPHYRISGARSQASSAETRRVQVARPADVRWRGPSGHPLVPCRRLRAPARPRAGARCSTRHRAPRRHEPAGAPNGGRGCRDDRLAAEQDPRDALGRSRGGYVTTARVIADGLGRGPVAFRMALGQAQELPHAVRLVGQLPRGPEWVFGDRGDTSPVVCGYIPDIGARPANPPQRHEAPVTCAAWIDNNRNPVERLWKSRAKQYRSLSGDWADTLPVLAYPQAPGHGRAPPRATAPRSDAQTQSSSPPPPRSPPKSPPESSVNEASWKSLPPPRAAPRSSLPPPSAPAPVAPPRPAAAALPSAE